ncbi:MAG: FecR domain-containing protein [Spirochaetes bacterium]|nr:FecR domain-containing protein [Spirochaetota bacterium]MBU0954631.1 FecR domain-containing protein [Spirochaetota bacterium]
MKRYIVLFSLALFAACLIFADAVATEVKGTVGVLISGRLQPVTVGMQLANDATVVTGANSEVSFRINNGTITLKSLTTAKINNMSQTAESSTANVALRNGTVVSNVQQIQGLKTNFTVTTPVATSSVRGTSHEVSFSQERGMSVSVLSGVVAVTAPRSGTRPVAAGVSYVQSAASTAAPQVVSTSTREADPVVTADIFSSNEETVTTTELDAAPQFIEQLVTIITPPPVITPTNGTVNVNILFP